MTVDMLILRIIGIKSTPQYLNTMYITTILAIWYTEKKEKCITPSDKKIEHTSASLTHLAQTNNSLKVMVQITISRPLKRCTVM